jgi:hypothetical protein
MGISSLLPRAKTWEDQCGTETAGAGRASLARAGNRPSAFPTAHRVRRVRASGRVAGAKVFIVTPSEIPPVNRNRLLIHIHGGCYVLFPGEAGATEAITMAGLEHFKVISATTAGHPKLKSRPAKTSGPVDGRGHPTNVKRCPARHLAIDLAGRLPAAGSGPGNLRPLVGFQVRGFRRPDRNRFRVAEGLPEPIGFRCC